MDYARTSLKENEKFVKIENFKSCIKAPNIIKNFIKRRLKWREGSLLRTVLENAPQGKNPNGRSRLI